MGLGREMKLCGGGLGKGVLEVGWEELMAVTESVISGAWIPVLKQVVQYDLAGSQDITGRKKGKKPQLYSVLAAPAMSCLFGRRRYDVNCHDSRGLTCEKLNTQPLFPGEIQTPSVC